MGRKSKKRDAEEREAATEEVKAELKGGKAQNLFGDSDSEGGEDNLKVNDEFAKEYEKKKQFNQMQSLRANFDDDDSSEDTEEDEDGNLLNPERDLKIHEALTKLRSGDKEAASKLITDVNTEVKDHLSTILKGDMNFKDKYTMKDYMRDKLLEKGARGAAYLEEDEEKMYEQNKPQPTASEEASAKAAFLAAVNDEEDGFELKKTEKRVVGDAAPYDPHKEQRVNDQLAALFANVDPNDEKETFLKNFFTQHGWQTTQDSNTDPTHDEIEEVLDNADREEAFEAEQKLFEQEYEKRKYRHEEEDTEIKSHPRSHMIEGSLRDTSSRKSARDRKKEREEQAKLKRDEELKRLKFLKRKEMDEKLSKIQEISGKNPEELFSLADLDEDFNPDDWDKQMAKMFNDDFYDEDDENFNPADMLEGLSDNDDDTAPNPANLSPEDLLRMDPDEDEEPDDTPKMSKKEIKKELESRKRALLKSKEQEVEADMENYYKLDYEDVIDGQKVRFKYRSVPGERFGMTDEEILKFDDRSLNAIAPLRFYAPYKTKSDNTRDKYIAQQNRKSIPDPSSAPATKSSKYREGMEPVFVKYNEEMLAEMNNTKEALTKIKSEKPAGETVEGSPKEAPKKKEPKNAEKAKDLSQRQQRRRREKPKPKLGKNARKKLKNKQQPEGSAPVKKSKQE
eukprot:TRINITY_DN20088_c0_g1_i1.p1 TRINITY_DN20088_c0_g1~~TRINITY_DN20088_c0_g1_i1.p1  ORF type:complete len:697 (+),score=223.09 TRINITY_DN20088_c0_g1_i1:56-2092(+)